MKCGLVRNLQALIQPPLKVPLGELRVVLSACQCALHLWEFLQFIQSRNYYILETFLKPTSFYHSHGFSPCISPTEKELIKVQHREG